MQISAKADYALRATIELASRGPSPVKGESISTTQKIPVKFLENILLELKRAGLVNTQRGANGGYWLAREPEAISLAEVIRAVEGPLINVRGLPPEAVSYVDTSSPLRDVWLNLQSTVQTLLESTTLRDILEYRTVQAPQEIEPAQSNPTM